MMRREVQIILFGKNEGKCQLGKPRRIWSDSIVVNLTVDGRAWIGLNLLFWMESRTTDSHLKRIICTKCFIPISRPIRRTVIFSLEILEKIMMNIF
jgi:hypothetical protein